MASSSAAPEPQPQPQPQPAALFARPADRELLDHLRRWIGGGAATLPSWIREADVYDHAPSELMVPAAATTAADGGLAWYFVTKLRHLGPHDQRIRRTAGGGTWKLEHDHPLASEADAVHLDIKRSLSFGVRDAYGRYGRTGHLMREFLLADGAGLVPGGEVALCELYHTPRGDDLAVAKAVDKARQRMKMAEEKKIAKSRRQQVMAAAMAAKARERTAAREEIRASKAQHRASLKAAAAAAIRAFKAAAPPAPPTTAPAAPPAPPTTAPAAAPLTASPAPPTTASAAAPLTASPAAPTTASAAAPLTASPAAPTTASAAAPLTASPAAPTTASAAARTPAPAVSPTDAVPAKGKKRGAAKEVDRAAAKAAAEAAFAAAVGRPRVPVPAWLTPDALSAFATSQQKKKSLATVSSATSSAHSPPKRLLLLQVGIEDNKVYGAQQLEDGPSFKKVKSIDCSGWVLDTRSKDKMTEGPCATA